MYGLRGLSGLKAWIERVRGCGQQEAICSGNTKRGPEAKKKRYYYLDPQMQEITVLPHFKGKNGIQLFGLWIFGPQETGRQFTGVNFLAPRANILSKTGPKAFIQRELLNKTGKDYF